VAPVPLFGNGTVQLVNIVQLFFPNIFNRYKRHHKDLKASLQIKDLFIRCVFLVYYCAVACFLLAGANLLLAGANLLLAGANSLLAGARFLLAVVRFLVSMKRFLLFLDDFESQVVYLFELV
jgi:hypothetical protein